MQLSFFAVQILLAFCFFSTGCLGFSNSNGRQDDLRYPLSTMASTLRRKHHLIRPNNHLKGRRSTLLQETASRSNNDDSSNAVFQRRNLPSFVYTLNASTKWLVTLANTLGIWTRVHQYEGPFVVIGAIMAVYFTDALKQVLNHDRPAGAPFADPGMPSSHSLVSFFLAAAWSNLVLSTSSVGCLLLGLSASIIALLRVVCGYHSWAQIGVGAVMGTGMGLSWAKLGSYLATHGHPVAVFRVSWSLYILGSGFFVAKNMRDWLHKDKHL